MASLDKNKNPAQQLYNIWLNYAEYVHGGLFAHVRSMFDRWSKGSLDKTFIERYFIPFDENPPYLGITYLRPGLQIRPSTFHQHQGVYQPGFTLEYRGYRIIDLRPDGSFSLWPAVYNTGPLSQWTFLREIYVASQKQILVVPEVPVNINPYVYCNAKNWVSPVPYLPMTHFVRSLGVEYFLECQKYGWVIKARPRGDNKNTPLLLNIQNTLEAGYALSAKRYERCKQKDTKSTRSQPSPRREEVSNLIAQHLIVQPPFNKEAYT